MLDLNWQKTVLISVLVVVVGALAWKGIIPQSYVVALFALFVPSPLQAKPVASILAGHDVNVAPEAAPTKPDVTS